MSQYAFFMFYSVAETGFHCDLMLQEKIYIYIILEEMGGVL